MATRRVRRMQAGPRNYDRFSSHGSATAAVNCCANGACDTAREYLRLVCRSIAVHETAFSAANSQRDGIVKQGVWFRISNMTARTANSSRSSRNVVRDLTVAGQPCASTCPSAGLPPLSS